MTFRDDLKKVIHLKSSTSNPVPDVVPIYERVQNDKSEHPSAANGRRGHVALLMIIIDILPYEDIWKAWMSKHTAQVHVFVHAKYPNEVKSPWVRQHLVRSCLWPEWGSLELTKAELLLLEEAVNHSSADFFCFVSESCVPVVSCSKLLRTNPSMSILNVRQQPENGYVECGQFAPLREYIPSDQIVKADQWCLLRRCDARAILSVQSLMLPLFGKVRCSDEMFIATTLALLKRDVEKRRVTYVEWYGDSRSPEHISLETLESVVSSRAYLFARKLKKHQDDILSVLRKYNVLPDL